MTTTRFEVMSMITWDYDLTVRRSVGPLVYVGTKKHWCMPSPSGYHHPRTDDELHTLMDDGDYTELQHYIARSRIRGVTREPAHVATYPEGKREVKACTSISYSGDTKYDEHVFLNVPDSVHDIILASIAGDP